MRKRKSKVEREANAPGNLPPVEFMEWWNPSSTEQPSGASVGGHPDAERVWSRKDPGRFTRRVYGVTANKAWLVDSYKQEYLRWVDADRPKREPFVSICATAERQAEFARGVKSLLAEIGKKMPGSPDGPGRQKLLQQQKVDLLNEKKPVRGHLMDDGDCRPIDF